MRAIGYRCENCHTVEIKPEVLKEWIFQSYTTERVLTFCSEGCRQHFKNWLDCGNSPDQEPQEFRSCQRVREGGYGDSFRPCGNKLPCPVHPFSS